jgi:hypothetical protein
VLTRRGCTTFKSHISDTTPSLTLIPVNTYIYIYIDYHYH